jgi:beta-glucosidase
MHVSFFHSARLLVPLVLISLLTSCVTAPRPPVMDPKQVAAAKALDTGSFWWGTSTSSFQNEDRGVAPGDPDYFLTDWDLFAQEGRAAVRGDDATFSWTHFDQDVQALKKLGVSHFRFSVEWARVEPEPGRYNEKAIRQYARMAQKLRAAGIEPIVTLWHFTFPSWLYENQPKTRSNFLHPEVRERWREYVAVMTKALTPHARFFVPQNEPNGAVQLGYLGGHWPPGLLLRPFSYKRALRESAEMFVEAADIIRESRPDAVIVSVHSLPSWRPHLLSDPTRATYHTMLRQNYDHLDMIHESVDVIGINYYYTQDATIPAFLRHGDGEKSSNYTQMGWEIEPEGLYRVIREVGDRYQKPMFVSENGIGTKNEQKKIKYLRDHINQVRRASGEGYDMRGYFAWTLVDNFEWTEGFEPKFGLSYMDPKTQTRILQPSARFYANVIKNQRLHPSVRSSGAPAKEDR